MSADFQGLNALAMSGEKNPDTKAESKLLGDIPHLPEAAPLSSDLSLPPAFPHLCRGLTSVYKQIYLGVALNRATLIFLTITPSWNSNLGLRETKTGYESRLTLG